MELFLNTLYKVLTHNKFKIFKPNHVETIIKFIRYLGRTDNMLKSLLNDIINISKGMGQTEALMQYGMALAHWERKQKLESNK